jgi:TonB-linked SusC/RagA family outer membrane protein
MRIFVVLLICFLTALPGFAQQAKEITGTVKGANGEALIGANVTIAGSRTGTITDADGVFRLSVPYGTATLSITYIGYVAQKVNLGNKNHIEAILEEDSKTMNEVVVVGYGSQKKATLTGAVSAVNSKEIVITKNENAVNSLTGKIPGVRISQLSSRPGAFETQMDIRGLGTPLVVVDGIPRDVDYFARMDADEIESVSVLKDASAAVYGLRSANGVVLVTTKRGSNAGGLDIQYSMNYGWQQFLHVPDNVDALQYMTLVNEKNRRDFGSNYMNYGDPSKIIYSDQDRQPYLNGTKQTTDWMSAIFKNTVPQYQHNITMNGGTDKMKYYFNLGYMKQDGSLKSGSMNYNRWNFRSNIDANITKRLHSSLSVGGYMDETNQPNTDIWAIYKSVWVQQPNADLYANGNPGYLNNYLVRDDNPLAVTNSDITGYSRYINRVFNGQMSLSYDVPKIEGLVAKAMYSYDFKQGDNTDFRKLFYQYNYDPTTDTYSPIMRHATNGNSSIQRSSYPSYSTLMQLSLNYKHSFLQAHNVEALALFEEGYSSWDNFYAFREMSLNSEYLFAGNAANQIGNMDKNGLGDRTSQAFVGKLNYDYKGKYLLEFAFREDGSSKFPEGSRWGFFPSASLGWRISEEPFVKHALPQLSNLKVRASYGKTGDDGSANTYPSTVVGYEIRPNDIGWIYNGSLTNGVSPTAIPNPDLTWYTAKMFDIGADFELWRGLLGGSFDYFNRNRDGLLATSSAIIPGTVGATMPQENLEGDRTFGYELVLTHRNKIGDVSYYVNAQISATRSQWRSRVESKAGNSYDNWRNRTANRYKDIWWGTTYQGQFQNYNQIYNYPVAIGAGGTVPGDYYYEDWNGDGVINGNDAHPIATYGMPLFNYGITLGGSWKGIDLSMNFQGAAQVYYRYTEALAEPLSFGGGGTMTKFWDRWHPVDPNADIFDPSTQWVKGYYPVTGSPLADGTRAIQNASYIRLKTIEIGYTLPKRLLAGTGVKELRVYFSGYNLLTITGLKDMDPEHPGGEGGATDNNTINTYKYPINRTFNLGASIKF